jgi:transposase
MNSLEEHLQLMNAFAGFCYDLKNWPNFLHKHGYEVYAIEWKFKNSKGKSVKPEIIVKSKRHNNAILVE